MSVGGQGHVSVEGQGQVSAGGQGHVNSEGQGQVSTGGQGCVSTETAIYMAKSEASEKTNPVIP